MASPPTTGCGDLDVAKSRLREACKAGRDALEPAHRARAAERIAATGIGFASPASGAIVSAYCAIGSELDPSRLLARLASAGYRTALPVLQPRGKPLIFRGWAPGGPLETRMWGIEQPPATAPEVEPDILLMPLLAFDVRGWRLGYGGGFYDRTVEGLRALKPIIAIGLAFDEQEIADVPHGALDQPLDWILTPAGARPLGR